jgi:hypothetical protein
MEEGLTSRQLLSQGIDKEVERLGIQRLTKAEQAKLHYDCITIGRFMVIRRLTRSCTCTVCA